MRTDRSRRHRSTRRTRLIKPGTTFARCERRPIPLSDRTPGRWQEGEAAPQPRGLNCRMDTAQLVRAASPPRCGLAASASSMLSRNAHCGKTRNKRAHTVRQPIRPDSRDGRQCQTPLDILRAGTPVGAQAIARTTDPMSEARATGPCWFRTPPSSITSQGTVAERVPGPSWNLTRFGHRSNKRARSISGDRGHQRPASPSSNDDPGHRDRTTPTRDHLHSRSHSGQEMARGLAYRSLSGQTSARLLGPNSEASGGTYRCRDRTSGRDRRLSQRRPRSSSRQGLPPRMAVLEASPGRPHTRS